MQNKGTDYIRHEENLLFNRLHYFLVGMAFIVAAFTLIVANSLTNDKHTIDEHLMPLVIILFSTGYLISYFFALMNFLNAHIIHQIASNLRAIDRYGHVHGFSTTRLYELDDYTWEQDPEITKMPWQLIWLFIQDSFNAFTPFNKNARKLGQYTWLIPSFFVLVWIAIWHFIIRDNVEANGYWWLVWSPWFTLFLVVFPFLFYYIVRCLAWVWVRLENGWLRTIAVGITVLLVAFCYSCLAAFRII